MKQVIIGFSKPSKFMIGAKIISLVEHTEFSHAYIRVFSTQADRDILYQASHGKVNCIAYHNFLSGNIPVAEFSYEMNDTRFENLIQYCIDALGAPYSYLGLIIIGLKKLFGIKIKGDGEKRFVCSEFAARAMPEFYTGDPDFADPSDLYYTLSQPRRGVTRIK